MHSRLSLHPGRGQGDVVEPSSGRRRITGIVLCWKGVLFFVFFFPMGGRLSFDICCFFDFWDLLSCSLGFSLLVSVRLMESFGRGASSRCWLPDRGS